MVHNGIGHILLLDFLWAHPNSLDWPIKSSGGPNNVCDIYMNIYIYIYKRKGRAHCVAGSLLFLIWLKESTYSRHGLNLGVEGKSSLTRNSRTITHPESRFLNTRKEQEMAFHGINQGERFRFCRLMHA